MLVKNNVIVSVKTYITLVYKSEHYSSFFFILLISNEILFFFSSEIEVTVFICIRHIRDLKKDHQIYLILIDWAKYMLGSF